MNWVGRGGSGTYGARGGCGVCGVPSFRRAGAGVWRSPLFCLSVSTALIIGTLRLLRARAPRVCAVIVTAGVCRDRKIELLHSGASFAWMAAYKLGWRRIRYGFTHIQ